jgi:hypothetical protein
VPAGLAAAAERGPRPTLPHPNARLPAQRLRSEVEHGTEQGDKLQQEIDALDGESQVGRGAGTQRRLRVRVACRRGLVGGRRCCHPGTACCCCRCLRKCGLLAASLGWLRPPPCCPWHFCPFCAPNGLSLSHPPAGRHRAQGAAGGAAERDCRLRRGPVPHPDAIRDACAPERRDVPPPEGGRVFLFVLFCFFGGRGVEG